MKPVLINFMRRLDKTLTKIHKNQRIYVTTDWGSVSIILHGLYQAVWKYPYVIVNMQTFKSIITTCQYLVIGEFTLGRDVKVYQFINLLQRIPYLSHEVKIVGT